MRNWHVRISIFFFVLLSFFLFSNNLAHADTGLCTWNIYPQPSAGTNSYKITVTYHGLSEINFIFANFYDLSSTVSLTTPPSSWYPQTGGGEYATGIASNTESISDGESITWNADITIPILWGGIDTAVFDSTTVLDSNHLKCSGHVDQNEITYDNLDQINLNVSSLKQTAEPWQGLVYDSANLWSPTNSSIRSWGCALTSAAMVLNYHGLFKLPDSAVITPGTLNIWLKNEKDGYVRNGLVNWLAISRLSKKAKQSGYNENFHYDALEFSRLGSNSKDQLKADLEAGIPGILEEPGHFIVAKGKTSTSFLINDPFYDRLTLSDGYLDSYLSLLRFVPSNTDLSYFMLIGDDNLSLNLLNAANISIGDNFTSQPIQNPLDQTQKSGSAITELLSKAPSSGEYKLVVKPNTPSLYSLDLYLYDRNGEPYVKSITGFATPTKPDTLLITFDHEDSSNISSYKITTYASVIEDIKEAIILNKINKGLGNNLILQIKLAEKLHPKRKPQSLVILKVTQQLLTISRGSLLKPDAYTILSEDIKALVSTF